MQSTVGLSDQWREAVPNLSYVVPKDEIIQYFLHRFVLLSVYGRRVEPYLSILAQSLSLLLSVILLEVSGPSLHRCRLSEPRWIMSVNGNSSQNSTHHVDYNISQAAGTKSTIHRSKQFMFTRQHLAIPGVSSSCMAPKAPIGPKEMTGKNTQTCRQSSGR